MKFILLLLGLSSCMIQRLHRGQGERNAGVVRKPPVQRIPQLQPKNHQLGYKDDNTRSGVVSKPPVRRIPQPQPENYQLEQKDGNTGAGAMAAAFMFSWLWGDSDDSDGMDSKDIESQLTSFFITNASSDQAASQMLEFLEFVLSEMDQRKEKIFENLDSHSKFDDKDTAALRDFMCSTGAISRNTIKRALKTMTEIRTYNSKLQKCSDAKEMQNVFILSWISENVLLPYLVEEVSSKVAEYCGEIIAHDAVSFQLIDMYIFKKFLTENGSVTGTNLTKKDTTLLCAMLLQMRKHTVHDTLNYLPKNVQLPSKILLREARRKYLDMES